jgi:DNA-binding transcriptional LysR family regulator
VVVASPGYLAGRPVPALPQDLTAHQCINMRLPTYDSVYAWEFEKAGQALQVQVGGQCTFNTTPQMLQAALDGYGFAYVPQDLVLAHVAAGRLLRVLDDWCPTWPGYHLYYPSRRQSSPAFALVVDALRIRQSF